MNKIMFLICILISFMAGAEGNLWQNYLDEISGQKIQENCKPRKYEAKGEVIGSVLMYHGFTACPQQYFELAEELSNKGFNVYLPLLPGHGEEWDEGSESPHQNLPIYENINEVNNKLINKMSNIMKSETGLRILVGLSAGGALAQYSLTLTPNLYHRALVIAPFLRTSREKEWHKPYERLYPELADILGRFPGLRNILYGWGGVCEGIERDGGRAGTCHFKPSNVAGLQRFGSTLKKKYRSLKRGEISTKIQVVGVEKDKAVSNSEIRWLNKLMVKKDLNISECFYPYPANHSLLSKFDSPNEDKFWIEDVYTKTIKFISNGESFPKERCMKRD